MAKLPRNSSNIFVSPGFSGSSARGALGRAALCARTGRVGSVAATGTAPNQSTVARPVAFQSSCGVVTGVVTARLYSSFLLDVRH